MIKTINPQNYVEGTVTKTGIVYADITTVLFSLPDNGIIAYREIGAFIETFDPVTGDPETVKLPLSVDPLKFTDLEMKALLDATGGYFNSDQSNLLVANMKEYSDLIILDNITLKPENYFGITVDKWEQVP